MYSCNDAQYIKELASGTDSHRVSLTCYFVIGDKGLSRITADDLASETTISSDVLTADIVEDYATLTLKTIWMANKALSAVVDGDRRVPPLHYSHAMFADDDIFVSLPVFVSWLRKMPLIGFYAGHKHLYSVPIWCDNGLHQNCVNRSLYPHEYYPVYASGFAYVMSHDTIQTLVQSALRHALMGNPLLGNNEDAMVGLLLAEGGVYLTGDLGFHHYGQDLYACPGGGTPPMVVGNAPDQVLERLAQNERAGSVNLCHGIT